jgi:hypothetical protein
MPASAIPGRAAARRLPSAPGGSWEPTGPLPIYSMAQGELGLL